MAEAPSGDDAPRGPSAAAYVAGLRAFYERGHEFERQSLDEAGTERALALAESEGRLQDAASAALALGVFRSAVGRSGEAAAALSRPALEAGFDDPSAAWPPFGLIAKLELARVLSQSGDFAEGMAVLEKALSHAAAAGPAGRVYEAHVLLSVGLVHGIRSEPVPYAEHTLRCLRLARTLGHARLEAHASVNLAGAYLTLLRFEDAAPLYDDALQRSRSLGSRRLEALVLAGQGSLAGMTGDLDRNEALVTASNEIFEALGDGFQCARQLLLFGQTALDAGDVPRAGRALERALALTEAGGFHAVAGDVLAALSCVYEREGDPPRALATLRRAVAARAAHADARSEERLRTLEVRHQLTAARREAERTRIAAAALATHNAELAAAVARIETQARDLRAILECLPDPIWVLRAGGDAWLNPAAARLFGLPAGELIAGDPLDAPGSRLVPTPGHREALAFEAARRSPVRLEGTRLERPGASPLSVTIQSVAFDFEGAPAVLYALHDLTEFARLEAEVRRLDQLAALGTMAGGAAHEINNPLATIQGNLEYLLGDLRRGVEPPADERLQCLEDAAVAARRVSDIIHALRTFASLRRPTLSLASAERILRASVASARPTFRRPHQVWVTCDPELELVTGEALLVQALTQLICNAAAALESAGDVAGGGIEVTAVYLPSGRVRFEVRDEGPGIAPALHARIFEPFFTTRPVGQGKGLGLSVCLGIARALSGTLSVESTPGAGACFRLEVPASPTGGATMPGASPTVSAASPR
ncbi:ATP-binding protein [Myxococcota bacterium]|nr:ATP-binding protein [Myxococcota bacterium]